MNAIYIFLIRNDVWIYILCGLGLIWYLSELWRARSILSQAMFGLEREKGRQMQNSALFFIAFFGLTAGAVAYVNIQVKPTLPPELLRPPTPTPNLMATPLASPTPLDSLPQEQATPTPPLIPTVTLPADSEREGAAPPGLTPIPSPTATPDAPANDTPPDEPVEPAEPPTASGCSDQINISQPVNGAVVSGAVSFFGVAAAENFAFYKLEASGPETDGRWASVIGGTVNQPVLGGLLGNASMGAWAPGQYDFRLTVIDMTSNEVGHCTIQLTVE